MSDNHAKESREGNPGFPGEPINKALYDYHLLEELELLDKITDNYIGPNDVFEGGEKENVIAYHLEKSRFKVLRDQYT